MRIAIVEDNTQDRDVLHAAIDRVYHKRSEQHTVTCFADGDEILENYQAGFDLIFLDIQMARVDGMKTAVKIRLMDDKVYIVFLTRMANYAIRGYAVNAYDFMVKPVNDILLAQLLDKLESAIRLCSTHPISLSTDKGLLWMDMAQIFYLETERHGLKVVTSKGEYHMRASLKHMEEQLSSFHFFRCNSCYLVNLRCVESVDQKSMTVAGHTLTISRPRYKEFMEALNRFMGGSAV